MNPRRILEFPWYVLLLAVLPVVRFHEANFRHIEPGDGLRFVLIAVGAALLMMWGAAKAWRGVGRGALIVAPVVVVAVSGYAIGAVWSAVLLSVAVVAGVALLRLRVDVAPVGVILNFVALALVLSPVVAMVQAKRAVTPPVPTPLSDQIPELVVAADTTPPDIYYIMADGLGQPGYLEAAYRLPRGSVKAPFEALGFTFASLAQAHYPQTALSQASTLNMAFVQDLLETPDPESRDRRPLADLVGNSRVKRALESAGYRTVSYPSGYPITRMHGVEKRRSPLVDPDMLEYHVQGEGVLSLALPLMGRGPADLAFAMRRGRLNYLFDELPDARRGIPDDQPVFVYAHLMAPHPPFVFGRSGEALGSRRLFHYGDGNHWHHWHDGDGLDYRLLYRDQTEHVLARLVATVEAIIARSPRPPVIIIQGDHGPGFGTKWHSVRETNHAERLGIFNAWFIPGGAPEGLGQDLGAVNTFPVLFNALFDAGLPLSPERRWFCRWDQPYVYQTPPRR